MSEKKQTSPPAYRLVAGDELGVLRVVEVPAGPRWSEAAMTNKWGEADKEAAVCSLCCSSSSTSGSAGCGPVLLAVGRKGRRVQLLDALSGSRVAEFTAAAKTAAAAAGAAAAGSRDSQAQVSALAFIAADGERPLQLVVGTTDGVISICSSSGDGSSGSGSSWGVARSFEAGSTITCLAVDDAGSHLLIGFEGQQPSLWELSTASRVWQAKGGKPNKLGLVDKAHTTAIAFLNSSTSNSSSGGGGSDAAANGSAAAAAAGGGTQDGAAAIIARRFIAGSVSAKLHLYNTAVGRRPQLEVVFGETRVTALAPESSGTRVWAANGTGHIQLLDLQQKKLLDALKGAGGSVRGLALAPAGEPRIASVGLDRFLRVHDTTSRASCCRVYLKQQLTAVCWLPVPQAAAPAVVTTAEAAAGEAAASAAVEQAEQAKRKKRKGKSHRAEGAAADESAQVAATAAGGKRRRKPSAAAGSA